MGGQAGQSPEVPGVILEAENGLFMGRNAISRENKPVRVYLQFFVVLFVFWGILGAFFLPCLAAQQAEHLN